MPKFPDIPYENPLELGPDGPEIVQAIEALAEAGILKGREDGKFQGWEANTRYELALALHRLYKLLPAETPNTLSLIEIFLLIQQYGMLLAQAQNAEVGDRVETPPAIKVNYGGKRFAVGVYAVREA